MSIFLAFIPYLYYIFYLFISLLILKQVIKLFSITLKITFWFFKKSLIIILFIYYFIINPFVNLIVLYLLFQLTSDKYYQEQNVMLYNSIKNKLILKFTIIKLMIKKFFLIISTFLRNNLFLFTFLPWFSKKNIFFIQYFKNLKKKNNLAWFFLNKR